MKPIALLKSLGIDTERLVNYRRLYGTVTTTFAYVDEQGIPDSSWAYSICPITGIVECRDTYFSLTEAALQYNKKIYDKERKDSNPTEHH